MYDEVLYTTEENDDIHYYYGDTEITEEEYNIYYKQRRYTFLDYYEWHSLWAANFLLRQSPPKGKIFHFQAYRSLQIEIKLHCPFVSLLKSNVLSLQP